MRFPIFGRALRVAPAALLLATAGPALAQGAALHAAPPAAARVDPALAAVDSLLRATYPADGPGAAVVVARGDEVLLRRAYGLADVELGVPLAPEHRFRIGSITKQFTAVAVLLLADEGKLSLDDEITDFFPDWPTHGHRITVEHLLTHTSGIRSYTGMPDFMERMRSDLPLEELIAVFRDEPMDFAPGTDWSYNNSGYVLLGAIVEHVSGQPYADFLRARLFEPLGMTGTAYEDVGAVVPGRVSGYALGDGGEIRNAAYLSMSLPHAAGALISTVDDQLRWQRAVAEGRLLRPETWRRAFTAFPLADGRSSGYGYGWFVATVGEAGTVEHGGDINGFSSDGLWIPSADVHVVVLSNVERGFADPARVSLAAAERLLGVPASPIPAASVAPERLDEYAGVYRVSEEERRVVVRDGGALYSVRGAAPRQELRALGEDEFVYPESGTRVTFLRGADGRVSGMRLRPRLGPDPLPSPRTAESADSVLAAASEGIDLPRAVLERYVGEYELGPDFVLSVRLEGDGLVAQATGQPPITLLARSESRFATREVPAAVEFERDAAGAVTGLVLEQGGRRMPARRIR